MGGFICVALIVIALLWCKIWPFIVMLNFEGAAREGKKRKEEELKNKKK